MSNIRGLVEIPYSEITKDERAYEMMLLRDQYNNTYADIGTEFKVSGERVRAIYEKIKLKQIRLYINHLSIVYGYGNTSYFSNIYYIADKCYLTRRNTAIYFEKEYGDVLTEYRKGEPGIPERFLEELPRLITEVNNETIGRIIYLHEVEKKKFSDIGKEFQLLPAKARDVYDSYYRCQIIAIWEIISDGNIDNSIWNFYPHTQNSKILYDYLKRDFPQFFKLN